MYIIIQRERNLALSTSSFQIAQKKLKRKKGKKMTEETKQRRKEKKLSFLCLTASQALGRLLLSSKFLSNDNFAIPYLPFIYNRFSSLPDNIRAIGTVPRYICQHSTNLRTYPSPCIYIYIPGSTLLLLRTRCFRPKTKTHPDRSS